MSTAAREFSASSQKEPGGGALHYPAQNCRERTSMGGGLQTARRRGRVWTGAVVCLLLSAGWVPSGQAAPSDTEFSKTKAQEFEARLDETGCELERNSRFRELSRQQPKEAVQFVTGNVLFALAHEMGHVLITEMGLPVLGREENAADSLASLAALRIDDPFSHRVPINVVNGFFVSEKRDRDHGEKPAFHDEHGLNRERALEIVCLMVGSDPEKFADLAEAAHLPEERQGTCQGDHSNAQWSWDALLKPHRRGIFAAKTKIDVIYGDGERGLDVFAHLFRSTRLLETAAAIASEEYVWRRPLTLEMRTCGSSSGATWDVRSARVTLCYEMAAEFAQLYRDYVVREGRAAMPKESGDH